MNTIYLPFQSLKGLTLISVAVEKNKIVFESECGRRFYMLHEKDCCERVEIESIDGNLDDLLHAPILVADESTNRGNKKSDDDRTCTWTFYKLATVKGWVDIRWYGTSNGYYSESVDFVEYAVTP